MIYKTMYIMTEPFEPGAALTVMTIVQPEALVPAMPEVFSLLDQMDTQCPLQFKNMQALKFPKLLFHE